MLPFLIGMMSKSKAEDALKDYEQGVRSEDDEERPLQDDVDVDMDLVTEDSTATALANIGTCQNPNCQKEIRALRRQNEALKAEIKEKDAKIAKLEVSIGAVSEAQDECSMTPEQFQKLLEERREVARIMKFEAEAKRLEGLRQIQDMKSRNGVHPLDYFPEEIWAFILEKLPPADRANIYQVHDVFRNLLEPCRIQSILFPLIMDYMIPFVKKVCRGRGRRRQVFLLNKLLGLRSVSKSFRDSVDAWIEQDILTAMKTAEQKDSRRFGDKIFYISDNKSVLNKMRRFSKNQRLVPRALKISLVVRRMAYPSSSDSEDEEPRRLRYSLSDLEEEDDDNFPRNNGDDDDDSLSSSSDSDEEPNPPPRGFLEVFDIFKGTVNEFLERVGDQLFRFELHCGYINMYDNDNQGLSFTQIYMVLREWLLLMPNLKWLSLGVESYVVPGRQMNVVDPATLETLEMPSLESLERVDLHVRYGMNNNFAICDAILNANPHVRIYNFYGKNNHLEQVTNAEVLKLSLETPPVGLEKHNLALPLLEDISESSWKLKRLTLLMSARYESIYDIFKCLERLHLLEDLSLRLSHVTIGGHSKYLKLPSLKKFKLEFGQGIRIKCEEGFTFTFSLQFLIHCEELEELLWFNDCMDLEVIRSKIEGNNQAMIDFKAGLGDLSGSNIWNIFPRLGYIKVRLQESSSLGGTQYSTWEYRNRMMVSSKQSRLGL